MNNRQINPVLFNHDLFKLIASKMGIRERIYFKRTCKLAYELIGAVEANVKHDVLDVFNLMMTLDDVIKFSSLLHYCFPIHSPQEQDLLNTINTDPNNFIAYSLYSLIAHCDFVRKHSENIQNTYRLLQGNQCHEYGLFMRSLKFLIDFHLLQVINMEKMEYCELSNMIKGRYLNFRGCFFMHYDLSYQTMEGANLSEINFESANLRGMHLKGAILCFARLQRADLMNADLQTANLRSANCDNTKFSGAKLHGTNLCAAKIAGSFFNACRELDFQYDEYDEFQDAHLTGAIYNHETHMPTFFGPAKKGMKYAGPVVRDHAKCNIL